MKWNTELISVPFLDAVFQSENVFFFVCKFSNFQTQERYTKHRLFSFCLFCFYIYVRTVFPGCSAHLRITSDQNLYQMFSLVADKILKLAFT